jgi:hypothetical protein
MVLDEEGPGGPAPLLFTENETNAALLFGSENASPYVKDSIGDFVVGGRRDAVNPRAGDQVLRAFRARARPRRGAHRQAEAERGGARAGSLRNGLRGGLHHKEGRGRRVLRGAARARRPEARRVARQANAGLLWSKQFYNYIVEDWLRGRPELSPAARASARPGATATGPRSTPGTSSRCPTSGSIPGSPPGTWRST